ENGGPLGVLGSPTTDVLQRQGMLFFVRQSRYFGDPPSRRRCKPALEEVWVIQNDHPLDHVLEFAHVASIAMLHEPPERCRSEGERLAVEQLRVAADEVPGKMRDLFQAVA